ncbi:MAG: lipopolysaccharide biosynthesis protein [Dethiobacteria bacterium]
MNVFISSMMLLLQRNPYYRHVLILTSGTAFSQLLLVLASPLLTRIYTPGDFGLLSVYISIIEIFALLSSLKYEYAVPLARDEAGAANLLALCFGILLSVCFFATLCLWFTHSFLFHLLKVPGLEEYFWLFPVSLFGMGSLKILHYWAMRTKKFVPIARAKIRQSMGMIGIQIVTGFLGQGTFGLVLGDALGRLGGSGKLTYDFIKENLDVLKTNVSPPGIRQVAFRYKKFPLILTGSSLINEFAVHLPVVLLTLAYGPQVVGLFVLVQRITGLPLTLIGESINDVFMAEASSLLKDNPGRISKLYWDTFKHLLLLSIPFFLMVAFIAPWVFMFVFGQQWTEAGAYLRILTPMYLLQFVSIPVSATLLVFERQILQFLRDSHN